MAILSVTLDSKLPQVVLASLPHFPTKPYHDKVLQYQNILYYGITIPNHAIVW